MAEEEAKADDTVAELTPEEQKILARVLKKIEFDILNRVLRRLSIFLGIAVSILLIGGILNLNTCSTNIEGSVSQKLSSDPEIRDKIITKAQDNLKEIQDKLKTLNDRAAEVEKENSRAVSMATSDLHQIRLMIERISTELKEQTPSSTKKNGSNQN